MTINEITEGESITIKVDGNVDAYTSEEFVEAVTSACRNYKNIRVDLSGAIYFSSAGLRGLVMGQKIANVYKGSLELFGVNEVLMTILENTGLTKSLNIV